MAGAAGYLLAFAGFPGAMALEMELAEIRLEDVRQRTSYDNTT